MSDGALLKLDRAAEHIAHLADLFEQHRPFTYIVGTNTDTGERFLGSKRSNAVIDRAAIIGGEAAHAIRSALDLAYWPIVSPFVSDQRQARAVQFPFSRTEKRLEEAVKNRLAHLVSDKFFNAIMDLAPHPEQGGNRLLYLIDQLDAPDKHRHLTPFADYKHFSSRELRAQVPDMPNVIHNIGFTGARKDVSWYVPRLSPSCLGEIVAPSYHLFEKKLDLPISIVFQVSDPDFSAPLIPALNELARVARDAINLIRAAAQ